MQLKSLGYFEVLLVAVELLDEVLLIFIDSKSQQVNRSHAVVISAVLEFVNQVLSSAGGAMLPSRQLGLYNAKQA